MTAQVADEQHIDRQEKRYGLFRTQVVEKQPSRLLGDVLVVPPIPYSLVTLIILVLVPAAISFS